MNTTLSLKELGRRSLAVLLTVSMASMGSPFAYAVEDESDGSGTLIVQGDQVLDEATGDATPEIEGVLAEESGEVASSADDAMVVDAEKDASESPSEQADEEGITAVEDEEAIQDEGLDLVSEPQIDIVQEEAEVSTDSIDLALALDHAYIHYINQAIASPVSSLTLPAHQDFQFAASADEGYELSEVKMVVGGNSIVLTPDKEGMYHVASTHVVAGSKLVVTGKGTAIERTGSTFGIDEDVNTQNTFIYEDDDVKVTAMLSDPSTVPVGTKLRVTPVTSASTKYDFNTYMDALNNAAIEGAEYAQDNVLLYDVAFMDDDTEIHPDNGTVSLEFKFKKLQVSKGLGADATEDLEVFHLSHTDDATEEEEDLVVEDVTVADSEVIVEHVKANFDLNKKKSDDATFVLDGLSMIAFAKKTSSALELDEVDEQLARGSVDVEATVTLNRSWKSADVFELELSATDTASRQKLPEPAYAKTETIRVGEDTKHVAVFDHAYIAGLNFTEEDLGTTFGFLLSEVKGNAGGITYDSVMYNVAIEVVSKKSDDTLDIKVTYTDMAGNVVEEAEFANTYEASSASLSFEAQSALDTITNADRELERGEFEFVLMDAGGTELDRQTNGIYEAADGTKTELEDASTVQFDSIEYKAVGDYVYAISEVVPSEAEDNKLDGIEYESTTHYVQAHITDTKFDGQLDATYTYDNVEGNTTAPTFTNTYFGAVAVVSFDTYFYGADTERQFDFMMMPANDRFRPITIRASAVNLTQGTFNNNVAEVVSDPIMFKEPGTYRYVIFEQDLNLYDVTADDAWILVTVEVSEDAQTKVSYQMRTAEGVRDLEEGERPILYNNGLVSMSFRARALRAMAQRSLVASYAPVVRTVMQNGILQGGEFQFAIFAGDDTAGEPMQVVSNDANGLVAFDSILFDSEDIGTTHSYTIAELPANDEAVLYDSNFITLDLTVEEDEDGVMRIQSSYNAVDNDGEYTQTDDPVFINAYDTLVIHIVKRSREANEDGEHDGLPGAHYGLWMANPDGQDVYMGLGRNQLEVDGSLLESDENGNLYYDMPLVEGAAYYFLEEWPPPAGHLVDPYPTDYFTLVHEDGAFRIVYETEPEFATHCPGISYELKARKG